MENLIKKTLYKVLFYGKNILFLYLFFALLSLLSEIQILRQEGFYSSLKIYYENIINYSLHLIQGDFGTYLTGVRVRSINQDIWPYIWGSVKILSVSLFIGTIFSLILGIKFSVNRKRNKILQNILTLLISTPDFILILFLQMTVVFFNYKTGYSFIRIASLRENEAILLPIISMTVIPMVFFIKEIMNHTSSIITEEYIRTALSKGLTKWLIIKHHVLSSLILYLRADLLKVISISISNLFIIEHLFNIRGITRFMFHWNQYSVWLTGFIFLAIIFVALYLSMLLFLKGVRRYIIGE